MFSTQLSTCSRISRYYRKGMELGFLYREVRVFANLPNILVTYYGNWVYNSWNEATKWKKRSVLLRERLTKIFFATIIRSIKCWSNPAFLFSKFQQSNIVAPTLHSSSKPYWIILSLYGKRFKQNRRAFRAMISMNIYKMLALIRWCLKLSK